jgi:predicted GTPase
MGYSASQVRELAQTIEKSDCQLVVSGTPIDLSRLIETHKPILPVRYELDEIGHPNLEDVLKRF